MPRGTGVASAGDARLDYKNAISEGRANDDESYVIVARWQFWFVSAQSRHPRSLLSRDRTPCVRLFRKPEMMVRCVIGGKDSDIVDEIQQNSRHYLFNYASSRFEMMFEIHTMMST